MVERGTRGLPESETQRWDYETRFKSYLYRIGVLGNEGIEAINNFPERIELNDRWHNTLHEMKKESYDGLERWLPVGMTQDRSLDFLPENSIRGFYTHVMTLTADQIKEKYGIVHKIGEIHTHPSDWFNWLGVNLVVATKLVKDFEGFSDGDLYGMVDGSGLSIAAVVEKDHNYFVFRTAETTDLPAESPWRQPMAFNRHWTRKYGGYYLGKSPISFWPSPKFSVKQLNKGIAEAYNLALYKGKPGGELIRQYP